MNTDVFTWSSTDMSRNDPEVICHKFSLRADAKPVKQKPKRMNKERSHVISNKVDRLLQAGFIWEMFYLDWFSNPVLVKKKNENWRVCIDFLNLNEACPKDCYPLPRIDQLVEVTAGHELLSFMDAYSGYNQIKMKTKHPSSWVEEFTAIRWCHSDSKTQGPPSCGW